MKEDTPSYIAVRIIGGGPTGLGVVIDQFFSATAMDDFSRECEDRDILIYRLGTDFLTDGHTEGSR